MMDYADTIAALSTPPGESGIAVIRMSGARALDILDDTYRAMHGRRIGRKWTHRRLYHGRIVGARGEPIDEVMCAVMRAPDTYTGEDVVEVSCHGGSQVVSSVLRALYARGARPAQAGEFTKRAFLNGKMDLIQAEAVADLIHARTELQRQVAHEQLSGGLSGSIDSLADEMLELLGVIEANIDFVDEDIDRFDREAAGVTLGSHKGTLDRLLASAAFSKPFREGYRVAIVGPVNAGKSSIFNRLLGENRAIVTEIPGTTRDVLREPIVIEGLLFVLHDTAGLRGEPGDRVESIGVNRANEAVQSADLVLFVVDATQTFSIDAVARIRELDPRKSLLVWNKIDLLEPAGWRTLHALSAEIGSVRVSAETGEGFATLKQEIVRIVAGGVLDRVARERIVLNVRLSSLLGAASERVTALKAGVEGKEPLEILALEARALLEFYEEATGRRYHAGLLDVIFSRFCIGK